MRRLAVLLLGLVALAGCGGGDETTARETTAQETTAEQAASPEASSAGSVQELTNVLQLRSDFEADAGKTRVILLFSPT